MSRTPKLYRLSVIVVLMIVLAVQGVPGARGAASSLQVADQTEADSAIRKALSQAVSQSQDVPAFLLFDIQADRIDYAQTGDQALVWLSMADKESGEVLASEPGLALAYLVSGQWYVVLSSDAGFQDRLAGLPAELMTGQVASGFISPGGDQAQPESGPIGGFYLPWQAGQSKWLTMAAKHWSCLTNCRYASDWADGTHFRLLAAKGGLVYAYKDTCQNDNHSCTNYLIIQDRTTSPYSYQIYFHLEHNSIPAVLKVINPSDPPQVYQGQFIANADNTGYSTGSHLHFMVVTNPYYCSPTYCNGDSYWWGTSVDITFRDVTTNWDAATQGGRPCTQEDVSYGLCAEWRATYTSGNTGVPPPDGGITHPSDKSMVTGSSMLLSGWASSSQGIVSMQVVVNDDGEWQNLGPLQTASPFSTTVNICDADIPDGLFDMALDVLDGAGRQSRIGLQHLAMDSSCPAPTSPAPTCVPTANQAAFFTGINYTSDCIVLDIGTYPDADDLSPISNHTITSLKLGENVQAILYDGFDFSQRQETFSQSDHNLADNRVDSQWVSSLMVLPRAVNPGAASVLEPYGPGAASPTSVDSLDLFWVNGDGATSFESKLYSSSVICDAQDLPTPLMSRGFTAGTSWAVGTLNPGSYTACVRGRILDKNNTPYYSAWAAKTFIVAQGSLPGGTPLSTPYLDAMESASSGWTSSGLWRWVSDTYFGSSNHDWAFNNTSGDYSEDSATSGDLTSPQITLPTGSSYYLRFVYHYETEDDTINWDQRWVQISKNGGSFENLWQLSGDVMNYGLHSRVVNLSAYASSTIRVRFHFNSLDIYHNAYRTGWYVDEVSINSTPPAASCNESSSNDTPDTATTLSYGQTVSADICPAGDVDYYKVSAAQGDALVVDINAQTLNPSSELDATLAVSVQGDPYSIQTENDDELLGIQLDSFLVYDIPQSGVYYLRVRPYDHPGVGGTTYNYTLHVYKGGENANGDQTDPTISLTNPAPGRAWRSESQVITAQAADNQGGSGMRSVEFFWHSSDWLSGEWQPLWTDWNSANGWNALKNASSLAEGEIIGIAALATDWAGNTSVAVDFDVVIDDTPPVVSFTGNLPTEDTAMLLQWEASDATSGIAYFTLEMNRDNSGWQPLDDQMASSTRQSWFVGAFGHHYDFRLQAVDFAGNESSAALLSTTLTTCQPDTFEASGDGTLPNAKVLPLGVSQAHNFCGTSDQDWVKFIPVAGQTYLLWAVTDANTASAPVLSLYRADGVLLLQDSAAGYGQWAVIRWVAPNNNTYYVQARSLDPAVAGTHVIYRLWAGQGEFSYLVMIAK